MRNLLFEKRNCTIEQNGDRNFVLTLLDANNHGLENRVASMLKEWRHQGKNKVLWWDNRALFLKTKNQYS